MLPHDEDDVAEGSGVLPIQVYLALAPGCDFEGLGVGGVHYAVAWPLAGHGLQEATSLTFTAPVG